MTSFPFHPSPAQREGQVIALPPISRCNAGRRGGLDLTGHRFGRWTVVRKAERRGKYGARLWLCRCDCGKEREVFAGNLRHGHTTGCGIGCPRRQKKRREIKDNQLDYRRWSKLRRSGLLCAEWEFSFQEYFAVIGKIERYCRVIARNPGQPLGPSNFAILRGQPHLGIVWVDGEPWDRKRLAAHCMVTRQRVCQKITKLRIKFGITEEEAMAKVLNEFTEFVSKGDERFRKYADGQIWQLEAGADFNCKAESFITGARMWANINGYVVRSRKMDNAVIIQFVQKPDVKVNGDGVPPST